MDQLPTQDLPATERRLGLSRRSVVRAGAWTAPTVVAVMAVPEAANASDGTSPTAVWSVSNGVSNGTSTDLSCRSDDGAPTTATGGTRGFQLLYFTVTKSGGPDLSSISMIVNLASGGTSSGAAYNTNFSTLGGWTTAADATGGVRTFSFSYGALAGSSATPGTATIKVAIGASGSSPAATVITNADLPGSVTFTAAGVTRTFTIAQATGSNVTGPT